MLRLLVVAAVAAAAAGSDACGAGDASCELAEAEEAALLQKRLASSLKADHRSKSSAKGITFEGGGFLAFAVHSALVSGLLSAFPDSAGNLEELFAEYNVISSNSGGTWYAASLAYSSWFANLTHELAGDPANAGQLFTDTWVAGLLSLSDLGEPAEDPACDASRVAEHFLKANDTKRGLSERQKQNLQQLVATMSEGNMTWEVYVTSMLERASQVPKDAKLGSDVQPWAAGKEWLLCVSVPTPNYNDWVLTDKYNNVWDYSSGSNVSDSNIYHAMDSGSIKEWPFYLPAKFSTLLGDSGSAPPQPFCATTDCFDLKAVYRQGKDRMGRDKAVSQGLGYVALDAFSDELPLGSAVSSSSAFAGMVAMFPELASKLARDCVDFSSWVSNKPGGEAYKSATDIRARAYATNGSNFEEFHEGSVMAVIDGAYTENTGVAWAVGAGATEVVAFVEKFSALELMFSGADEQTGVCPGCGLAFQIFETSIDEAKKQYEEMPSLSLPSSDYEFLTGMKLGTITTKTMDNKWFGVAAGTEVKLHVLCVETEKLRIGGSFTLNHFEDYGTLVGEIVQTMAAQDNVEEVRKALDEWFSASA